jgi:hypothetical protein
MPASIQEAIQHSGEDVAVVGGVIEACLQHSPDPRSPIVGGDLTRRTRLNTNEADSIQTGQD